MDVVHNKVHLARVISSSHNLREGFHIQDADFVPDVYMGDEKKDVDLCMYGPGSRRTTTAAMRMLSTGGQIIIMWTSTVLVAS